MYDAMGRLVEEFSADDVTEICSPPRFCGDPPPPTPTLAYLYAGSRLLSTEDGNGPHYLTADHLGSPRINTDGSGNVVARHDYMPFGEEISSSQRTSTVGYSGDSVRKQFTGYEIDAETGLDFAQARTFASNFGRFTSVDPVMASARDPQSFNRYVYCLNRPTTCTDPSGAVPGDYYDYAGNILGDDGKKDGKVYFATMTSRNGTDTYVDKRSIRETTMAEVERARKNAVPLHPGTETESIHQLTGSALPTAEAAMSGVPKGVANAAIDLANLNDATLLSGIGLPRIGSSSDAEESYSGAGETGVLAGVSFAVPGLLAVGGEATSIVTGEQAPVSFFEGATYSDKVANQMLRTSDQFHAFPEAVKDFEFTDCTVTRFNGGDGQPYVRLDIKGGIGNYDGTFEFIKDQNGVINHRFFRPN